MNYSLRALKKRVFNPQLLLMPSTVCKFSAHQIDSATFQCGYIFCQYCLRLPSEDNRMVCTLAINDHNTYDFEGLEGM